MHNFLRITPHLPRCFETRQSRKTREMRTIAAQRKVSYEDRNVDPGFRRHDAQNTALSELRGKYSITAHPLISRSRTLFHAA